MFTIHSECHPLKPTWVLLSAHLLQVICADCRRLIYSTDLAEDRKVKWFRQA